MIKNINSGPGVSVSTSGPAWPYFNNNSNNAFAGSVRYNGNTQHLEVYDGLSWLVLGTYSPLVELDFQTKEIVGWARAKMLEEQQLLELAKKHPGLQEAYERLEIMKTLTLKEESKND